jgi:hypothetical protein
VEAGFMKMQVSVDDVIEVLPEAGGAESSGKATWAADESQAAAKAIAKHPKTLRIVVTHAS